MVRSGVVHLVAVVAIIALLNPAARAVEKAKPIELSIDASEVTRKLLHAKLVIPAAPGALTLYYPKWIQGEHAPSGPIADLSGLTITASGKPLAWKRDPVDLFAFHTTVPDGADAVEVALEYLAPSGTGGFSAAASSTARLAVLNWNTVLVYPKGTPVRDIPVRASVTLPRGWKFGCALPVEETKAEATRFGAVSLETLIDSPVLCGQFFKEVPLGTPNGIPHYLDMACDSEAGLALPSEVKGQYERLVTESGALFGARHYRSYRFLLTMSDHVAHFGEEHHECSDNRVPERMFLDDTYRKQSTAWLLSHEFVHSWNGKYRRPAGLCTPDYQEPMKTDLLWVYEGLTEYLGFVLAARSGLYTQQLSRDNLAQVADWAKNQGGRAWRPLEDTATAAPHLYFARGDWAARRRGTDFYDEGALVWLDADTLIREKSGGKKSLDDFCRAFHGGEDGPPTVKPYTFEDVVAGLNGVVAHDWKAFLEKRLRTPGAEPPLDGLTRGGWKLTYTDKPSDLLAARDADHKSTDLTASVGLVLGEDGKVGDVTPAGPADKAGVGPGMKVVAVNGRRLTAERLRQAVAATARGMPLKLLLENNEYFETVTLDYSGGERYPHLERVADSPDRVGDIFRPRAGKPAAAAGGQ